MTDTLPCMKVAGGRGVIAEWLVLWSIIRKFRDETNTSTEVLLREFFLGASGAAVGATFDWKEPNVDEEKGGYAA